MANTKKEEVSQEVKKEFVRDPEYFAIQQKNNPALAGIYLDEYNNYLKGLGSSTKTYEEAKGLGQDSITLETPMGEVAVEVSEAVVTPVEELEVIPPNGSNEEIEPEKVDEEIDAAIAELAEDTPPVGMDLSTKEGKVAFLKVNGHPLANMSRKDETVDAKVAEIIK